MRSTAEPLQNMFEHCRTRSVAGHCRTRSATAEHPWAPQNMISHWRTCVALQNHCRTCLNTAEHGRSQATAEHGQDPLQNTVTVHCRTRWTTGEHAGTVANCFCLNVQARVSWVPISGSKSYFAILVGSSPGQTEDKHCVGMPRVGRTSGCWVRRVLQGHVTALELQIRQAKQMTFR
jgi:hypothetical protein